MLGVVPDDRDDVDAAACNRAIARSAACGALPCPDAGLVSTVTVPIGALVTESACRG